MHSGCFIYKKLQPAFCATLNIKGQTPLSPNAVKLRNGSKNYLHAAKKNKRFALSIEHSVLTIEH